MPPKARINSKQKGAAFERKVCVRLSLWASDMTREDLYWRSAMSGGRATLVSRKGRGQAVTAQAGDLSCIHPMGNFLLELYTVECKFYKELNWHSLVYGHPGLLDQIYHPTRAAAAKHGRQPLIIAKQNLRDELVVTTQAGFEIMQGCAPAVVLVPRCTFHEHDAVVLDLNMFLQECHPQLMARRTESAKGAPRTRERYLDSLEAAWNPGARSKPPTARRRVTDVAPVSRTRRRVSDTTSQRRRVADV